MTYSERQ